MSSPTRAPARALRAVLAYAGANTALLISGAVGAVVFAVLLFASANVYEAVADEDGISGLDQPVLDFARSLRSPAGERWVTAFTDQGGTVLMAFTAVTITAAMFAHWRRRSILTLMGIAAAGSLLFTAVGKTVVGRARPPLELAVAPYEYAPSFPSGHTLNSTVIALMLAYLAWWLSDRAWVRVSFPILGALWAIAMGLSRVYLGHHWFTDVVFGWLFGLAWLALLITVHRVLLRLEARTPQAGAADAAQQEGLREYEPDSSG